MRIITFATILFVCAMAVASNTHDHNGEVDSGKEVWESSSITGVADGGENDKVVFVNTPDSDEESLESQLLESSRRRRRSSKKKKSTKGEPCLADRNRQFSTVDLVFVLGFLSKKSH